VSRREAGVSRAVHSRRHAAPPFLATPVTGPLMSRLHDRPHEIEMTLEPGSVEHLSQLISHVVAPAFLLGAVAGFISLLHDRLLAVVGRVRELSKGGDFEFSEEDRGRIVRRLRRRASLLNIAIFFGLLSGVAALVLIIAAFGAALMEVHHVWVAAVLFIAAAIFLLCSVVVFAVDVKMALAGHDLH
jgi:hypothetical protein